MIKLINIYNSILEQKILKYKLYLDLDGVLADFDKQFEKISGGIKPRDYEAKYGKEYFWRLITNEGEKYWTDMEWMKDGKQLFDYLKPYSPTILSAPSRNRSSRTGKKIWVKNKLDNTPLILANAEDKQNYSSPNSILIDDRLSNIQQWNDKGGIGIFHTNTKDTLKQLKKYGI